MMRFAYADPPYVGQAAKHYKSEEVDHKALLLTLDGFDAWALSLSSTSLSLVLQLARPLYPEGLRIGAWVKPFCSFKANVNPAYAWEPVIFYGGRKRGREKATIRDWVSENITLKRGLSGAKPEKFSWWIFSMLGAEPGDDFWDLFPGTGAVSEAWLSYQNDIVAAEKSVMSYGSKSC